MTLRELLREMRSIGMLLFGVSSPEVLEQARVRRERFRALLG
jgi:hypothetical protein